MTQGLIFDVKEFSVNDGPGIRTTIFFKGCPLHCSWCHNPEGISRQTELKEAGPACLDCGNCRVPCAHPECQPFGRCIHVCPLGRLTACGRLTSAQDLAGQVKRQAQFLTRNNGGITLSGGEPLAQPDFLFVLMAALKPLHVAVETSGYAPAQHFAQMTRLADLVIIDIKHMDSAIHQRFTGVGNERILANIRLLIEDSLPFIVRIPLIPGVNDTPENLSAAAAFLSGAKALQRVELLPYNILAGAKYRAVGQEYDPGFKQDAAPYMDMQAFEARGIACAVL